MDGGWVGMSYPPLGGSGPPCSVSVLAGCWGDEASLDMVPVSGEHGLLILYAINSISPGSEDPPVE